MVSVQGGVSDATGERYARLGGAGYGLVRPSMSNRDCRSPHPALRCAAQSSPVAESLVGVGST